MGVCCSIVAGERRGGRDGGEVWGGVHRLLVATPPHRGEGTQSCLRTTEDTG